MARPPVMVRHVLAFLVLAFAVSPVVPLRAEPATAPTFPDRSNAFAGVPFGATIEEARQKWQLEEIEGASVPGDALGLYLREEESHVLGGVLAREVIYYFLKGRFYAVSFSTPDIRQTGILRQALELGYGFAPHKSGGASLVWPGAAVSAQLLVNESTGEGRVLLFSNPLQLEYEQSLKESAARTAAGL